MNIGKYTSFIIIALLSLCDVSAQDGKSNLDKAFMSLNSYKKSSDSWDRVNFQEYLTKSAEEGNPEAQYWYYHFANHKPFKEEYYPDVKLSDSLAVDYLKKSFKQGNIHAIGEMGLLMAYGNEKRGITKNREKSFEFLQQASSLNDPEIYFALGYHHYYRADSIPSSLHEGIKCFRKAKDINKKKYKWESSVGELKILYDMGRYNDAYPLQREWLVTVKKQLQYESDSKYDKLTPFLPWPEYHDILRAINIFINAGHYDDLNLVPYFSSSTSNKLSYPDKKEDFSKWNYENPYFMYKMLDLLENAYIGKGADKVSLSQNNALKYFYSLNPEPDGEHCYTRSLYYRYCENYDLELSFLQKGVFKNNISCIFALASRYYYGNSYFPINRNKAFAILKDLKDWSEYFTSTNRLDYAKACYLLSILYYSNECPEHDYVKAVTYVKKFLNNGRGASKAMIGEAFRMLAVCYRFGRGVEKDEKKEKEYSRLAAKYGNADEQKINNWLQHTEREQKEIPKGKHVD